MSGVHYEVQSVLARYGITASTVQPFGGGFSGAQLWRISAGREESCLRRWPPEHPDEARLRFIHGVQRHAGERLEFVPIPKQTLDGQSFVRGHEHFWELAPWMPGMADFHRQPTAIRLAAALEALARFHLAVIDLPGHPPRTGVAPGIVDRLARLEAARRDIVSRIAQQAPHIAWPELRLRAERWLRLFSAHQVELYTQLSVAARLSVPLQPCLRDIWHDHVLFLGDRVSGLIDFGGVRIDTVAGDLARLLGSLVGDDQNAWQAGLAAYEGLRPLSPTERELLPAFDAANVLLSGLNWLDWLVLQGRDFVDKQAVLGRLDETLARLEHRNRPGAGELIAEP